MMKLNKRTSEQLKKEKFLAVSNITAMTITFLIFGAFITLIAFTQSAIRYFEKQALVTVYFKDDFPESRILELKQELENDDRVANVRYISKEDAYNIFVELNKGDEVLLQAVTPSILPASVEITTKNIADLEPVASELTNLDGAEEVKYFKDIIQKFKTWSNVAYGVGFGLLVLFTAVSVSIIVITIRLNINARGKELEILKLVGATDEYVKKPLIHQSIYFGLISAGIAASILLAISGIIQLLGLFGGRLEFAILPDVSISIFVFTLALCMLIMLCGYMLGYFGSKTAIKKYLSY